ncbi:MAG: fructose-6-phosphate aldolase [Candidatus Kerfeldbacteria bacterium]|nr:fructose-6-phosphate aldolase [Candidatus Kerfeldbacteria bacterium]
MIKRLCCLRNGVGRSQEAICAIVDGSVSAEVISTTSRGMLAEALTLAKIHPNITVKLPITATAMPVVTKLHQAGIMTNVTLVFSVNQALLAAKAGATFVSPFVGRLDDTHEDGIQLVSEIVQLYRTHGFTTQVLAASMRHPQHVAQAALVGADVATVPYSVFTQLFEHPLTDSGLKKFLADWKTVKK